MPPWFDALAQVYMVSESPSPRLMEYDTARGARRIYDLSRAMGKKNGASAVTLVPQEGDLGSVFYINGPEGADVEHIHAGTITVFAFPVVYNCDSYGLL